MLQDLTYFGAGETCLPAINAAAMVASLGAQNCAIIPQTVTGFDFGDNQFTIGDGQNVVSQMGQARVRSSAPNHMFRLTGYVNLSGVQGLRFNMANAPLGSTAILMGVADAFVMKVALKNLTFEDCASAIDDEVSTNATAYHLWEDITCIWPRGPQINSKRSRGMMRLNRVDVLAVNDGRTAPVAQQNWPLFKIRDYIGIELTKCNATGQLWTKPQVFNTLARGFDFDGTGAAPEAGRYLWIRDCMSEGSLGHGMVVTNTELFYPETLNNQASLGFGLYMENIYEVIGGNLRARGANDLGNISAPGSSGLYAKNVSDGYLTNCHSVNFSGTGACLDSCNRVSIDGLVSHNNTGWGFQEIHASDRNRVMGYVTYSNAAGDYQKVGPNTVISQ